MLKTHELQKQSVMSVKVNSWQRNCMFILDLCGSSIIYSKLIQMNLNSVLCSSVQPKTEQLACFARIFPMALELVHHFENTMAAAWVETCRLRGGNIIIKPHFYVTGGSEISHVHFFHKLFHIFTGLIFFMFSELVDAPRT